MSVPKWIKVRREQLVYVVVFGLAFLIYPGQNIYMTGALPQVEVKKEIGLKKPIAAPYPQRKIEYEPGEEVTAGGVVIMDVGSGTFLYKRNERVLFAPASTTKIMTALVALDAYPLDEVVKVSMLVGDGQKMGLFLGETMSVENLLYGLLIQSGNDAAYALAVHFPGGLEAFVAAMNSRANELNLKDTQFTNPAGFDDPNHRMSPIDLARLAKAALDSPVIRKMVAIPQITISDTTYSYYHKLTNVNELLGKIPGVGGIKTGWTAEAGENLVTLVERNGHKVILVVLHSKNRFADTEILINWVFGGHEWKKMED